MASVRAQTVTSRRVRGCSCARRLAARPRSFVLLSCVGAFMLIGLIAAALLTGESRPARALGSASQRQSEIRVAGRLSDSGKTAASIAPSKRHGATFPASSSTRGDRLDKRTASLPVLSSSATRRPRGAVVAPNPAGRAATASSTRQLIGHVTTASPVRQLMDHAATASSARGPGPLDSLDTLVPTVAVSGPSGPSGATTGPVVYIVTVSGDGATPTGSVTVFDGAGGSCSIPNLDDTGSGTCSITENAAESPFSVTASYSGDLNYTSATGYTNEDVALATPTVTVTGQSGATTGPVAYGVTVSGPTGAATPTGSVTVSDGTNTCSITSLTSGSGTCSLIENASEDGQTVTASYSGDLNYTSATGKTTETVAKATPTVSVSGPSSAVTGVIDYVVTISGQGASPSGSVTISDGTKMSSGALNTCTIALNAEGIGACALQEGTGTYQVTAKYTGDYNYGAASTTTTEVVNETTTSLDVSTSTLVYGLEQSATFSVTVYPPVGDDTAPSGTTVHLMAGKQKLCVTSPLVLTIVTVINPVSGLPVQITEATAACHLAPAAIAAGKYSVTADFPGEAGSFVGSTSPPAPLTVISAPTSTTLSVSNSTTTYGRESSEALTTRVKGPAGPSYVTGSVTVKTASKTLCTTTLKEGTGTCKLTRFQLSVGRYSLVADYRGTKSLVSSSSKPLTLSVVGALTSTALSLSRTTVAFRTEQSERFTAQVAVPAGMAYASGAVAVTRGSRKLCTITLTRGKGTCSLTATELPVGSYQISARYEGSNELKASTSPGKKLVVTKAS